MGEGVATVDRDGMVAAVGPGQAAIMVRYQGQVAVFNALVPLGAPVDSVPEARNFIDTHVFFSFSQHKYI